MCNIVQEAPENIAQEKILINVALILLGQYWTGKNLCNVVHEGPDNTAHEKFVINVVWTKSLYGNFYFGSVNFLIITGCCEYRANIAHKKSRATLNKKTRLYGTDELNFHLKGDGQSSCPRRRAFNFAFMNYCHEKFESRNNAAMFDKFEERINKFIECSEGSKMSYQLYIYNKDQVLALILAIVTTHM